MLLSIAMLFILAGCVLLKARPHKATRFLPVREALDESRPLGPFHGFLYLDQERFMRKNQKVTDWYIAPVDTSVLEEMIAQSDVSDEKKVARLGEVREIARYTKVVFEHFLKSHETHPKNIITRPTKKSLILELALVEVEPTTWLINVAGTVAGFFFPGAGLIGYFASGTVAVEGIVRDPQNKKVLLEFKDREKDKIAPFTIKDFQRYAHLREAIQDWAELFAEFVSTNGEKEISETLPFTLNPL